MKRSLEFVTVLLVLLVVGPSLAPAQSDSPVGSWFGKIRGAETGTAFLTFNSDQTLSGMGYSRRNAIPFAIRGVWSVGTRGEILADFSQTTIGVSQAATAVAISREGKRLSLKATGPQGDFVFRARPATDVTPSLAEAAGMASATVSNACTDQCNLNYATCQYQALAGRNFCMTRCSMTLYPKKCYPACRSYYNQAMNNCDATNKLCLAACPR